MPDPKAQRSFFETINMLNKKEVQKSTQNLAETTKQIEEAGPEAFEAMNGLFQQIGGPIQAGISYFTGIIQSETIGAQLNLMNTLMGLFESDAGKATISALSDLLSFAINNTAGIIKVIDIVTNFLFKLASYNPGERQAPPGTLPTDIIDVFKNLIVGWISS